MPEHRKDWRSHNDKTLLLPAFTTQGESIGKLSGFCSNTWKVETRERYVREALGVKTKEACNWIGFSLDEVRRAVRMMSGQEYKAGGIRLPLIHDVPLKREQAIQVVKDMGWPTPPRSACWMCPNQNDDEWRSLSLEEFQLAVELDHRIREDDPFAFLHSSGIPLGQVDFTKPPDLFDGAGYCSSGGCFT